VSGIEKSPLEDFGEELPSGRVRCRYRGCRRVCTSWNGLVIHLRKTHGVSWRDRGV
jgi:hypothetical protein